MTIDSTSGREGDVIAAADRYLAERGWRTSRIPVSPGRDDLLAQTDTKPVITLSTHLDTVPPFIPPTLDGDHLTGRGACDAKGQAAALVCAAEALRDSGIGVALLFVVGEEVGHDGARVANGHAIGTNVLINGEPTESTLALGTKGALRFILRTSGKAAHSAYPHLGHSATEDLARLLADLDALEKPVDEVLGATTVNIGLLEGGVAYNVMAPSAEAKLMARLVGPDEALKQNITRWVNGRAQVEFGEMVPAVRLTPLAGFDTSVVAYATDVPNLTSWGTPYLFGPGTIHVAHTDHEFISVRELRESVTTIERLALAALAT